MSGLKIYGVSGSRAQRTLWMAEELKAELGFEYEHKPVHFVDESKTPEYLAINPNGRVPAMDDNGFILFESLAINLYLAKKHGESALAPKNEQEEALATQWSLWALTEIEDNVIALVIRHPAVAMFPPNEEIENAARAGLERPLKVLEAHLANRDYIIADRFTVADLNVAGVMSMTAIIQYDFSPYPNVKAWLDKCLARPANAASRAL